MDILCTDKTGTLTQGTVRLADALDLDGRRSAHVLEAAYLNAFHHTGFANPIDSAVLSATHVETIGTARLAEIPYDFQRKRLSVLVEKDGAALLLTKGAVENVLAACEAVQLADDRVVPLASARDAVHQRFVALSGQGYRVLGVARKMLASPTRAIACGFVK
jgi:Mg2+-importing ATPase